jgi:N-acetyl-alpha-D-muramate 1-phosphate uridylyltransferase
VARVPFEALVYAAGLGTRLAPLTDRVPKALVEVGGRPLLAIVAERLVAAGAERLVINVCHHAEQIERWVTEHDLGCEVRLSREEGGPYETGGGLWHARAHFSRRRPLVLHNVDVLSDVALDALVADHQASGVLVTLAVMERTTTRRLLFDDVGLLGRVDEGARLDVRSRPARGDLSPLAFAGIHAASPDLLGRLLERGRFPILDAYLRLVGEGARIAPWRVDGRRWIDVGRPADLERAQGLGLHREAPPAHA